MRVEPGDGEARLGQSEVAPEGGVRDVRLCIVGLREFTGGFWPSMSRINSSTYASFSSAGQSA